MVLINLINYFSWVVCFCRFLPNDGVGAGKAPSLQEGFPRLSSGPQSYHTIRPLNCLNYFQFSMLLVQDYTITFYVQAFVYGLNW